MASLTLDIPDDLLADLTARAQRLGCAGVEELLVAILLAELHDGDESDVGGPPHLSNRSDDEIKALLLERVRDPRPAIELTPEYWEGLRDRARGRQTQG
jgi:hypothetical protein